MSGVVLVMLATGDLRAVQKAVASRGLVILTVSSPGELLWRLEDPDIAVAGLIVEVGSASDDRAELLRHVRTSHPKVARVALVPSSDLRVDEDCFSVTVSDMDALPYILGVALVQASVS